MTLEGLAGLLAQGRFPLRGETLAHAAIDGFLRSHMIAFEREVRLSPEDRPDFVVEGRWVIEVKMRRAVRKDILAQIERYAAHDQIDGLILLSNRAVSLPREIGGKRAIFVSMGGAWM